jgi:hypothetical protein
MKAGQKNNLSLGLGILTGLNLFVSLAIAQNTEEAVGRLEISSCTGIECLQMTAPENLSLSPSAHFISNEEERLTIITDPLTELLEIVDSRETGSFMVTMNVTDLTKTGGTEKIPRDKIGIMSFNGTADTPENITVDSVPTDPSVQSMIDPDSWAANGHNETYQEINSDPSYIPENWIYYFTDGEVNILEAVAGPRQKSYSIGLVYFFKTPAEPYLPTDPLLALRDGSYSTTATFTLQIP